MAANPNKGALLHHVDRGAGMPLVLVHGFPVDGRMWAAQVGELSTRWRTIAPDLPGFGRSTPAAAAFTIESLADDVHRLLAHLGALPCALAGFSMGGYVALAFAEKYAADLRALILIDTKAEADTAEQRQGRQAMAELARSKGSSAVAEQMLPRMLAPDTPLARPAVARALRGLMEACPPATIERALFAMRDRPNRAALLPRLEVPVLVIVGDADAITPVAVAQGMVKQIPRAELAVVRGAGHMAPMEQPAQVSRAMQRFLNDLAS